MAEGQLTLPVVPGPALVVGPVFVCFELEGKPGHKARHRSRIVFPRGGKAFIHNYPDPDTKAYEQVLARAGAVFMRGRQPTTRSVSLLVHSYREPPASWSQHDRGMALIGAIHPTSRPDWDNYGKITDALNLIVWHDDSQVTDGRVIKRFSARPALRIEVREFVDPIVG